MTMTPQQWRKVKSIVMEAMDLEPPERVGYVARACEEDTKIRREVDSLLRADGEGTLPPPAEPPPDATALPEPGGSMLVGRRVGRYRISRLIGMGGMGAVYEATRDDLARPVALKVMRAGLISAAATARFQREANMLSRLDHPGIARIYDSGMHDSELGPIPYFAMELIPQALAITEYARVQHLSTRDRVAIFATVCDAVHHGHQRGVIHRDLKPSNILVPRSTHAPSLTAAPSSASSTTTLLGDATAKVIDFGIARSTDADMTLASFESAPSAMAGTLAYMSPEQCAFDPADIDTRSDVYGLGVVLYELLLGRLPYDVADKSLPEAIRVIQESPAARPSAIEPRLGNDLSVILLKCLAKERGQRYNSASELASDLRCWLADLPITARPASRMYAVRLFARRNRSLVLAGGIAAGAVVVGLISTTVALHRAVTERDRARHAESLAHEEQQRAKGIADFLQGVLRSTSAPMLASTYRDAEISPIASGGANATPAWAHATKAESVRDVVERAKRSLQAGVLQDRKLAAELRLLTLQLLITQTGTSEQNNELVRAGPTELREAAAELGPTHASVLATTLMLSGTMAGDREATRLVREAYVAAKSELGKGDARTLELGRRLLVLLQGDDEASERRKVTSELVAHAVAEHGTESRITLACMLQAASAAVTDGRLEDAARVGRETLVRLGSDSDVSDDLARTALGLSIADLPRVPATRDTLTRIAQVQERMLDGVRARFAGDARATFDAATALTSTLVQLGEFEHAADIMREVARESASAFGPTFHVTTKSQSRVARLLVWAGGDLEEALHLADTAAANSVTGSGAPLGDYEVFDRATALDVRRARGEADAALKGIEQLIRDYQAASNGHLSWFGTYLYSISARSLHALGRTDEARERWTLAIQEGEAMDTRTNALRIMTLRGAAEFYAKHGPASLAENTRTLLNECFVAEQ